MVYYVAFVVQAISIHALVKRATAINSHFYGGELISIHALVKRATVSDKQKAGDIKISIHALVKRATFDFVNFPHHRVIFQSTPS